MAEEFLGTKAQKLQLGEGTVILDFYAHWCGPCKRMDPMFKQLASAAKENGSQTVFFQIDVDTYDDLTEKYSVDAMPTIVVLVNGKEVERIEGFQERRLRELVAGRI